MNIAGYRDAKPKKKVCIWDDSWWLMLLRLFAFCWFDNALLGWQIRLKYCPRYNKTEITFPRPTGYISVKAGATVDPRQYITRHLYSFTLSGIHTSKIIPARLDSFLTFVAHGTEHRTNNLGPDTPSMSCVPF